MHIFTWLRSNFIVHSKVIIHFSSINPLNTYPITNNSFSLSCLCLFICSFGFCIFTITSIGFAFRFFNFILQNVQTTPIVWSLAFGYRFTFQVHFICIFLLTKHISVYRCVNIEWNRSIYRWNKISFGFIYRNKKNALHFDSSVFKNNKH